MNGFQKTTRSGQRAPYQVIDLGMAGGYCPVYVVNSEQSDQAGHDLAMRLRAAYAHLRRRSNQAFSSFSMSSDQYVLLSVLAEDGEATQQHLVRRCYSDTATIGTMVSLLEAKRLVTRTPHPRDRRALRVKLTASGRRLAKEMRESSSTIRVQLAAIFNQKERQSLVEFLDRIAKAMRPAGRKTAAQLRRQK